MKLRSPRSRYRHLHRPDVDARCGLGLAELLAAYDRAGILVKASKDAPRPQVSKDHATFNSRWRETDTDLAQYAPHALMSPFRSSKNSVRR